MSDDLHDLPPRKRVAVPAVTAERVESAVRQMRRRRRIRRSALAAGFSVLVCAAVAVPTLIHRSSSTDRLSATRPTPEVSTRPSPTSSTPPPGATSLSHVAQQTGVVVAMRGDFCGSRDVVKLNVQLGHSEGTAGAVRANQRGVFDAETPVDASVLRSSGSVTASCFGAAGGYGQLTAVVSRALLNQNQVGVEVSGNRFGVGQSCPAGATVSLRQSGARYHGPETSATVRSDGSYITPVFSAHLDGHERAQVAVTCVVAGRAAATLTTAVHLSLPAQAIRVYGDCLHPVAQPAAMVLACADQGVRLDDLHWTSWTTTHAIAIGTLVYNDCRPNCASGHFHSVTGTVVTLTEPVRGLDGQLVWSLVQTAPEPPGYATGPYGGRPQPLPTRPD